MMYISLTHYEGLDYTPAASLAIRAQAELIVDGKSEPIVSIG